MTPDPKDNHSADAVSAGLSDALKEKLCAVVDQLVGGSPKSDRAFEELCTKAAELFRRKVSFEATRNDTRDTLSEVLFSRLRQGFRALGGDTDAQQETRAAEWVMGALFGTAALNDFGTAVDKAMHRGASPREYSFAGLADFISLEEVLQLLGGGNHRGCLTLEKHDNRLDIYLNCGHIAYFDPHHMIRRLLPMQSNMNYREVSQKDVEAAEERHAKEGVPIFTTLKEAGYFKERELRESIRTLGAEILYEFLRDQDLVAFFYRRMDRLPDFVTEADLRMMVTPLLLEGSRRMDDWNKRIKVFPDLDEPVQPGPDMFARISSLNLGVHEIKMLAQINGENSPRALSVAMGLPVFDIYQTLVRFAAEGVVVPPSNGLAELAELEMSVEESMEQAFEALDANDDGKTFTLALDKVLGDL